MPRIEELQPTEPHGARALGRSCATFSRLPREQNTCSSKRSNCRPRTARRWPRSSWRASTRMIRTWKRPSGGLGQRLHAGAVRRRSALHARPVRSKRLHARTRHRRHCLRRIVLQRPRGVRGGSLRRWAAADRPQPEPVHLLGVRRRDRRVHAPAAPRRHALPQRYDLRRQRELPQRDVRRGAPAPRRRRQRLHGRRVLRHDGRHAHAHRGLRSHARSRRCAFRDARVDPRHARDEHRRRRDRGDVHRLRRPRGGRRAAT